MIPIDQPKVQDTSLRKVVRADSMMRVAKIVLCILGSLGVRAQAQRISSQEQGKRIVIAASTVLDGAGRVLHNTRIVVEGSKIVAHRSQGGAGGLRPARTDRVARLDRRARAHHLELRPGRKERGPGRNDTGRGLCRPPPMRG